MATKTSLETLWHTPEELWSLIAPLLGPEKPPGTPGRPAVPTGDPGGSGRGRLR